MTTKDKTTRIKLGLPDMAKELSSVSRTSHTLGYY